MRHPSLHRPTHRPCRIANHSGYLTLGLLQWLPIYHALPANPAPAVDHVPHVVDKDRLSARRARRSLRREAPTQPVEPASGAPHGVIRPFGSFTEVSHSGLHEPNRTLHHHQDHLKHRGLKQSFQNLPLNLLRKQQALIHLLLVQ